jgi:HK97 family phage major capsid protein
VQDAFPYGQQGSMFRDMLNAAHDPEAGARASKAKAMIEAAQKSADVAEVIPPGYRPDLYVGQEAERTPFANAHTRMSISDATPFKIPVFTSETGLAKLHVEGTNPTDGSIDFSELTVTPIAISGTFKASREMLDAANPNLDSIIIRAMAEDYAAHIEALCATAVLLSTSGTNATGGKVTAAVTTNMGAFTAARRYAADHLIVGSGYWAKLAAEVDGSGRPLNPYLAPSNAAGSVSTAIAGVSVNGLTAVLSTDAAAKQAVLMRKADHLLFTSARLSWRWEEVAGPANIVFAQFGYAAQVLTHAKGAVVFTDGTT